VFRHAPVMIQTMDSEGRLLQVNERWQQTLGYSETTVVGRRFDSFLQPGSSLRLRDLMATQVLNGAGHVEDIAVTLMRHDGAAIDKQMSLSLERDARGAASRIFGFLIEGEREAEAKIRQRDTWLRAILENAPVEIVLKDRDGRFLAVSRNVIVERGADMSAVIGKRTSDFFPPEIATVYEAADRQVVETGAAVQQEVKEVEDGQARYMHNAKFPLRDDTGYIIGVCSLSMETTSIRRMEEQLFQAQKMEAVGKLTGGIAHDFNNLLMVISGNLDLIASVQGRESPEIQAALRAIDRGADLTRRLLAFSRRQFLQPQPVALADLLEEIRELIHRTLGQSIGIEMFVPDILPPVMADPGQLHNAILNLALNARDAMPTGGTLSIGAIKVWLGETLGGAHVEAAPGEYVKLSVSDTGTGIDPETLGKVFEPFFTTREVGSGLGLSMVYGFIKQSGGHVSIDSTLGQGTTVELFLPLAGVPAGAAVAAGQTTTDAPRGRGETVLVVDDDMDIRTMAGATLRALGYRVTTAADPGGALAAHGAAGRFDILVTDILLGAGPRGTELARWLMDRQQDLKVLLITGYAGADQGETALPNGARLLTKPFSRQTLAGTLRDMLDPESPESAGRNG
jgi:PAS domain S-box-containing protein